MDEQINSIKRNFPNGSIPDAVFTFYKYYLENADSDFYDFETIVNGRSYLADLLNENVLNEFIVLYTDNAHDSVAIWLQNDQDPIDGFPVVLIDTHGIYEVCSSNFKEFLILFLTNRVHAIVSSWHAFLRQNIFNDLESPYVEFGMQKLNDIERESRDLFSKYDDFKEWVFSVAGKELQPIEIVERAIKSHPNLEEFLRSKNGLKF